jgi:hypothetical protein
MAKHNPDHDTDTCCCIQCVAERDYTISNYEGDELAQLLMTLGAEKDPNKLFAAGMSAVVFRLGQLAHAQGRLADNVRELLDGFEFVPEDDDS